MARADRPSRRRGRRSSVAASIGHKTPGQLHWEEKRRESPSLLPWKALTKEFRERQEQHVLRMAAAERAWDAGTQYDFQKGDTVRSEDGHEGTVTYVPDDYGHGSFVMVNISPREGASFWPNELTILKRAKPRAPKVAQTKPAEKTPGEARWDELRKSNPALLPWKKLSKEVRAREERYATHGCECGYCGKDEHGDRADPNPFVSYLPALW